MLSHASISVQPASHARNERLVQANFGRADLEHAKIAVPQHVFLVPFADLNF